MNDKSIFDMAMVNTENLVFVKNGSVDDGSFTVSIFLKESKHKDNEQYGLMFFTQKPSPKVMVFMNVLYNDGGSYESEINLYKQHISKITDVNYLGSNDVGFSAGMNVGIEVEGFTTKQEVDENGQPVFNEDGTPKMVNKPFSSSGTIN